MVMSENAADFAAFLAGTKNAAATRPPAKLPAFKARLMPASALAVRQENYQAMRSTVENAAAASSYFYQLVLLAGSEALYQKRQAGK